MVVIRFLSNDGRYLKCRNFVLVKSHYYDDQKSRNIIITESNNLEMTVSENHDRKSYLTDNPYLVYERTVTKRLVVSKIYLTA